MKGTGKFRKKKISFSMVSNDIIRDKKVSLKAKGLYALIQSYITLDNFTLYKDYLMSCCKEGEASFDGAWKELKSYGYLKQYKVNTRDGFSYEYELLDSPDPDFPDVGNPEVESPHMGNRGCINNTIDNNTVDNNIYPIISIEDVMDMIGYETFASSDKYQVREIALMIAEILNLPDKKLIRVAGENVPALTVKERFRLINQFHVGYILECLKQNQKPIKSLKNYLLTTLYNAPVTMETYYQSKVALEGW